MLQINELFPTISLNVVIDAVKKSNLNLELAVQYVLESDEFQQEQLKATNADLNKKEETKSNQDSNILPISVQQSVDSPILTPSHESNRDQTTSEEGNAIHLLSKYRDKIFQVRSVIPGLDPEIVAFQLEECEGDVEKCILCFLGETNFASNRLKHIDSTSHGQQKLTLNNSFSLC